MAEIAQRLVRENGPAVIFERVKGAEFPLVMNLFGSMKRVEIALGRHPEEIGKELVETVQAVNPPSLKGLWSRRGVIARARHMRVRNVRSAAVHEVIEQPDLSKLPVIKTWPRDGGRFITFGPTLTEDPRTHRRNYGLYRLQVFGPAETGMHWQSMKGGRAHHWEAERMNRPLPAAVVLGGDPILMLAAILPLPEDMDELAFAGFLRGAPVPLVHAKTINLRVPANAEFILEGEVPQKVRRMEGPFGDHFGHYSEAAEFPVFRLTRITRRAKPLYPATVVGKPPQEDKWMGIAVGAMVGPLIKVVNPNIVDLAAHDAAGFHNLLAVSVRERHPKEVLKTAFNLLGTGQLSLTKAMVLLRPEVNPRDWNAILRELWYRFEPEERMVLLGDRSARYPRLHELPDARRQQGGLRRGRPRAHLRGAARGRWSIRRGSTGGSRATSCSTADSSWSWYGRTPRAVLETLVRHEALGPIKFVAAVSDDVRLDDPENLMWGIFTRFDPARDMVFTEQRVPRARGRCIAGASGSTQHGRPAILSRWKCRRTS